MEEAERPERAWLWEEMRRDPDFQEFLDGLMRSIDERDWPADGDDEVGDDDA